MSTIAYLYVKARQGETITDDLRRTITDAGGKVPQNQFWLRRVQRGEVIEMKQEPPSASEMKKTFGKKAE